MHKYQSYQHIKPLTQEVAQRENNTLKDVKELWDYMNKGEHKGGGNTPLEEFTKMRYREWAVQNGMIGGHYEFDKQTIKTFKEKGFYVDFIPDSQYRKNKYAPQEIIDMMDSHMKTLYRLFRAIDEKREMSTDFIKELHALLLESQESIQVKNEQGEKEDVPLLKGTWKTQPNNPTIKKSTFYYCPPELVPQEMDNLVNWYREYEEQGVNALILATWLHHRLTYIHPFQVGNGRVARTLATFILLKNGYLPLMMRKEHRAEYIKELRKADKGNLKPLIDFFEFNQIVELRRVMELVRLSDETALYGEDDMFAMFEQDMREDIASGEMLKDTLISKLHFLCTKKFNNISSSVSNELKKFNTSYFSGIIAHNILTDEFESLVGEEAPCIYTMLTIQEESSYAILCLLIPYKTASGPSVKAVLHLLEEWGGDQEKALVASDIPFICQTNTGFEKIEKEFNTWFDANFKEIYNEYKKITKIHQPT